MTTNEIYIRKTIKEDQEQIWKLFKATIKSGEAFMQDENFTQQEWEQLWLGKNVESFSAILNNTVVGSYILKPNQPGHGSHVANGCYVVDVNHRGQGIGNQIAEHSINQAKSMGYLAMQFNAVISTNKAAVQLWNKYGFTIVGTLPKAFHHHQLGLIDVYIMYLALKP